MIEKNTNVTIKRFGRPFAVPAQDATSELKNIKYTKWNGDPLDEWYKTSDQQFLVVWDVNN